MLPRDVFPHQSGNGLGVVRLRFYGSASFFPSSAWSIYVDEPFRRKIMKLPDDHEPIAISPLGA